MNCIFFTKQFQEILHPSQRKLYLFAIFPHTHYVIANKFCSTPYFLSIEIYEKDYMQNKFKVVKVLIFVSNNNSTGKKMCPDLIII